MEGSSSKPFGFEAAPGVFVDPAALRFRFSRSGGPGGQHVNKVSTKVELRVRPDALRGLPPRALERLRAAAGRRITSEGDLLIVADESRSQFANRETCLARLRALVVEAMREPKVWRKTRPTRASRQRRLDEKKVRSRLKQRRGAMDQ